MRFMWGVYDNNIEGETSLKIDIQSRPVSKERTGGTAFGPLEAIANLTAF